MSTEITNFFDSKYDTPITANNQQQNNGVLQDMSNNTETTTSANEIMGVDNDLYSTYVEIMDNYDENEYLEQSERVGIFVKDYVNVFAGQPGVGKTWQIIRWLRDLSVGGEIFGGVVHNEPPRKCLLFAGETPKKEIEIRCRQLEKGDGIKRNYNNFHIADRKRADAKGVSLMLDTPQGQKHITNIIKLWAPDVVVFDSFISFSSKDENKAIDVRGVMTFLEQIAEQYHIAPVLVHHIRKRLSRERALPIEPDDIIGSSAFIRQGGFLFATELSPDEKTIKVREIKSWREPITPFSYTYQKLPDGSIVMDINPNARNGETAIKPNNNSVSRAENYRQRITDILKARETHTATAQELREILGISEKDEKEINSFKGSLHKMGKDNAIVRTGHGVYSLP